MTPTFIQDIKYLGKPYWVEIEGYKEMVYEVSGNFAFVASLIMGWDCRTVGETWEKQEEVNFAPRVRYWEEMPSDEDRKEAPWSDESRAWSISRIPSNEKERKAAWEEYLKTGRTQF